jgi:hypothetical protein
MMSIRAYHRAVLSCALLAALVTPVTSFGMWPDDQDVRRVTLGAVAVSEETIHGPDEVLAAEAQEHAGQTGSSNATSMTAPVTQPVAAADPPATTAPPAEVIPDAPPTAPVEEPPALLEANQLIVFYGSPLSDGLGILGKFTPEDAADRARRMAFKYDQKNGDRGAIGAMDLIYGMAMDHPTDNGLYVRYLEDHTVERYLRAAEAQGVELILDLQIGRGDILEEVRKIERFLLHPRVHVAIDPEYAVGPYGQPILTPGVITGDQINAVQDYVAALVRDHGLPQKMVVIHQFMDETVVGGESTQHPPEVELVLNMDAFGAFIDKVDKYREYADLPYAERDSYNIFLKQDDRVLSEEEVLDLLPEPDAVFYQ